MSQPNFKTLNVYQKINEIQKKITSVHKGSRVDVGQGRSYTAVSHDDVAALLHIPMADVGLAVEVNMIECNVISLEKETFYKGERQIKSSYQANVKMAVTFVNSDNPTDRFTVNSYGYAFDSGDKAIGKAESMAVKYVYLKNFNLESTDDEESRSFENESAYRQPVEQRQQQPNTAPRPAAPSAGTLTVELASKAQVDTLTRLYPGKNLTGLTKAQAKNLFESYNKGNK